ncbi:MAG: nucleotide exchange factor GrpE, partial [Propionibacteriaceae bacterium]|nr:nucleotide exchange factor GrpE [Propionibacteriaceae bacterium]
GIEAARAHDELAGGAKLLADELAKVAQKYGLTAYGAAGEAFDPRVHEALMAVDQPGYEVTSVAEVFQPGYKVKDKVLRPARVAVAHPSEADGRAEAGSAAAGGADSPAGPRSQDGPGGADDAAGPRDPASPGGSDEPAGPGGPASPAEDR